MLVLSRKEAERIRLGDSIVLTIIRIGGDKVRLGIEAPDDVLVLRDELEPHELAALEALQGASVKNASPEPAAGSPPGAEKSAAEPPSQTAAQPATPESDAA